MIWNGHLAEMTSLSAHGRELLMKAVYVVEETQQAILSPDKINLASLGNMVPHLHWHVIPAGAATAISPTRSGPRPASPRAPSPPS